MRNNTNNSMLFFNNKKIGVLQSGQTNKLTFMSAMNSDDGKCRGMIRAVWDFRGLVWNL